MDKKRRIATLVGLSIALGAPVIFRLVHKLVPEGWRNWLSPITLTIAEEWITTLLLLAIVVFWEKQPLASVGLKRVSWRDVLWGVVGFVVGVFVFALTTPLVRALGVGTTTGGISNLAPLPLLLRVGVVITAGITEEVQFRGYAIERLYGLTNRLGLSASIAYGLFVLFHIPFWGLGGTVQIGLWSVIVTLLYVLRRNLFSCILMHVLNDAFAFILLPVVLPQ